MEMGVRRAEAARRRASVGPTLLSCGSPDHRASPVPPPRPAAISPAFCSCLLQQSSHTEPP